jgi:sigma-B regulation protein RsbU (phosphoserine phosphatase)
VFDDFRARELPGTVRADLRALYRFYLDEERRADLERMRAPKRVLAMPLWILRSLLLKLTPARRVLLIVALVIALVGRATFHTSGVNVTLGLTPWAFLLLLFVLALELKDKLLAHDEIAVARQVQLALLPSRDPSPSGWTLWSHTRPANDVGGDLIDYIEAPSPGTLGVALGDVAGKGLGAALLMAKLQASLRAVAPGCRDLGALGDRLNGILCRDGLENRFATLFYLEAAESGGPGPVRFLNAGHNPPLLVRASGVEEIASAGLPLGMFPDSTYAEGTLRFDPGDLLIVYSDGLVEAHDALEKEFGLDRLKALAPALRDRPPAEAGRLLIEEVDRFLGGLRPHDDLSIVLMRQGGLPSAT